MLGALLSGCASLPGWMSGETRTAAPVARPFVPADRFVLADPDQEVVGRVQIVTARDEDTLPDLARRYDLGYDEIVGANPDVDVWLPGEGTAVLLPTRYVLPDAPRVGIVINIAARRLFWYPADEPGVVITHPVGIGRDEWKTPLGTSSVTDKIVDPAWYPPASIRREHAAQGDPLPAVVPPGPDNPLGSHALLLSLDGYLIHGTNKPYGVGMQVSHGCIRLYPEDIAAMFPDLPVGTPVRIVEQPVLAGWDGDELYLQAYAPPGEPGTTMTDGIEYLVAAAMKRRGIDARRAKLDWDRTDLLSGARRGLPIALTRSGPDLETLLQTASLVDPDAAEMATP